MTCGTLPKIPKVIDHEMITSCSFLKVTTMLILSDSQSTGLGFTDLKATAHLHQWYHHDEAGAPDPRTGVDQARKPPHRWRPKSMLCHSFQPWPHDLRPCLDTHWSHDNAQVKSVSLHMSHDLTHSVNKEFGLGRKIVVDDVIQQWNVNTPGLQGRNPQGFIPAYIYMYTYGNV